MYKRDERYYCLGSPKTVEDITYYTAKFYQYH